MVWAGPLSGSRLAVVLWNRCSVASTITTDWNVLGLKPNTSVSVRDLWLHEDVEGDAVSSFGAEVDPHDCKMFIFTPVATSRAEM
ncbi:alpha-galactosidase 3 isoform X1 [Cucumis melo var. makuwa]|uniref:alpha-galactosidase n=1 Tax=Cucumis melo var. makuwa TaxID=1194695 RepID=A0A5D3DG36_CUCMM|nr:alpha-galactosidase 3 isoform X1 [Cucumis melo var. makuwa]TYK22418.1 alpha-galactosidase 3 isoform X1 [Cucumis melo var. makuwa]